MLGFKVLVVFSGLIAGLVLGLPVKDDEIDELIYRLQELRNQNHYDDYEIIGGNSNQKQPIDLELKPLLYDYYANTLNPIYDKRNFDEIDRFAMPLVHHYPMKRNFDEIDAFAMPDYPQKRSFPSAMSHHGAVQSKRTPLPIKTNDKSSIYSPNFNEIDQSTYSDFMKRMYNDDRASSAALATAKRNFDEIDRFAMPRLILQNTLKRKIEAGNKVKKSITEPSIRDSSQSN